MCYTWWHICESLPLTRDESFLKTTMTPRCSAHDRLLSLGSLHSATISLGFFRHVCLQSTRPFSFRVCMESVRVGRGVKLKPALPPLAILRRSLDQGERSDLEIALAAAQREQRNNGRRSHHCKFNLAVDREISHSTKVNFCFKLS